MHNSIRIRNNLLHYTCVQRRLFMNQYHSNNIAHIVSIGLRVKNIVKTAKFYQNLLHLDIIEQNNIKIVLGISEKPLITLVKANNIQRKLEEGLYHVAYLLPNFETLGAWLHHALEQGFHLSGASDHLVSKAIYLEDPDGNGIEVYADSDENTWVYQKDQIKMITAQLDIDEILRNRNDVERFQPIIGHVHLAAKDNRKVAQFYKELGMGIMLDMGSAIFMSYGKYHHHLGINNWNMHQAHNYQKDSVNIDFMSIYSKAPTENKELTDPIGIKINII